MTPSPTTPARGASEEVLHLEDRTGRSTPLPREGRLVIGSARDRADLILAADDDVDPVHCTVIKEDEGGWSLQDLGSRAGTSVNGERIDRVRLWIGDVVKVGDAELRVIDPKLKLEMSGASGKDNEARRVAGFALERRLGTGGMGEVWLARQESLDRPVALKLLSPKLARDAGFVQRFQEEARAAAALSHPNVVVVYDVGSAEGRHYLAMEYMAGGSLEQEVAARGPLPWREAVAALRDCAAGLVYAEERSIVHRDVKPDNLMRSSAGTVKLADLGLAVSAQTDAGNGRILGTPHFLAPEQAKGGAPDHRSDLYSLGATAYRLLTARTPFQGKTSRDILRAHLTETPARPGAHVAGLPPALEELILELLRKDPGERPQSAAEVVQRLEGQLLDDAATARRGGPGRLLLAGTVLAAGTFALYLLRPGSDDPASGGTGDPGGRAAGGGQEQGPQPLGNGGQVSEVDGNGGEPDPEFFEGTQSTDGGVDVERELERRELEAQLALAAVPSDLPPTLELEQVRLVEERYAGTPTARSLAARIRNLEADIARVASEETNQARALELATATLSQAIGWPPAPAAAWDVGETLRALFATAQRIAPTPPPDPPAGVETSEPNETVLPSETAEIVDQPLGVPEQEDEVVASVSEDPAITSARAQLADAIVERALLELALVPPAVDKALEEARFEDAVQLIQETAARVRIPAPPPGLTPARWAELDALAESLRTRATGIADEVAERRRAVLTAEFTGLASLLGPRGTTRARLQSGEWDQATAELDAFASSALVPRTRALAESFALQLRTARQALTLLETTLGEDNWRRQSASLPISGRDQSVEIAGVDSKGLRVNDDGREIVIGWDAILPSPDVVSGLFQGRFRRPLSEDEERSVIEILRVSAAMRGAALARQVLDPSSDSILSKREGDELESVFRYALGRLEEADSIPDDDPLALNTARDEEAALALRRALDAFQEARWSESVAAIEALLRDMPGSLLVAFLSEGSKETSR